jgi:hypothetical protein
MPSQHADDQARFLLFATTDIWREGGFAYGGVLWAPTGLDRDGPVLKLMMVAADASVSSIGPSYALPPESAPSMRSMSARRCRHLEPTAITSSSAPVSSHWIAHRVSGMVGRRRLRAGL